MPLRPVVLASASPARLRLLRDAGLDPVVVVSHVDEEPLTRALAHDPRALVQALADAKATTVADGDSLPDGALVIGCDSMLAIDGMVHGKPGTPEVALARWKWLREREGALLTGHCVVDTASGESVSGVGTTILRFGSPTDAELEAYVASGEPLQVAGGFTLDGRSGAFVTGISGDPSNVIGLSLPLLRTLLARLGVGIVDLWL